jgi:hypothetical protein
MIHDRRKILKIDPIFAMEPEIDTVWAWLLQSEDRPDANGDRDDEEYEKERKKL